MAEDKTATKAKSITKSALYAEIAEKAELKKSDVAKVFDALHAVVVKQLGPKGPRVMTIPGLLKLKAKRVDKVKGGQRKINPLTKTEYVTKDKPAHTKVRALPLKGLKEQLK